MLAAASAEAAEAMAGKASIQPLPTVAAIAAMAVLPFLLLVLTSFLKIAVILAIVRSALGTPQLPPNSVLTGLALVLTIYIMAPVGMEIYEKVKPLTRERTESLFSQDSLDLLGRAAVRAEGPLRKFLMKHAHSEDREMFASLAHRLWPKPRGQAIKDTDLSIVIPAFVVSELKEAFQIGLLLFLPFLIIELLVANILMALGMHMVAPATIALPFKLLLFVLVDGWHLITRGLALGYG